MKCHVKDCENHDYQGVFIGIVCSPCYEFLSIGRGKHSQLYRNTVAADGFWPEKYNEETIGIELIGD